MWYKIDLLLFIPPKKLTKRTSQKGWEDDFHTTFDPEPVSPLRADERLSPTLTPQLEWNLLIPI